MTDSNQYSSQNLYEGAYLLCRGFKLAGKRQQGQKMVVLFEGHDARTEALKFYNGDI